MDLPDGMRVRKVQCAMPRFVPIWFRAQINSATMMAIKPCAVAAETFNSSCGPNWALSRNPQTPLSAKLCRRLALNRDRTFEELMTTYTDAPRDYDGFKTFTVYEIGLIDSPMGMRPVRKVQTPDEHAQWQRSRYASGGYLSASQAEMAKMLWLLKPLPGETGKEIVEKILEKV